MEEPNIKVQLKKEEEYSSLYPWYLCETDQDGNQIEYPYHNYPKKLVPYKYSASFTTKDIIYHPYISVSQEDDKYDDEFNTLYKKIGDDGLSPVDLTYDNRITARLTPKTRFSLFGDKKDIGEIILEIFDRDREYSLIRGFKEMESDISGYMPSLLSFELGLRKREFNEICKTVVDGSLKAFDVRISNLTGLYAEWQPEAQYPPAHIKVLTRSQDVVVPTDFNIKPSRLERVGELKVTSIIRGKW